MKKYLGLIFVICCFIGYFLIENFKQKELDPIEGFFSDATDLIQPPFIHYDNKYYHRNASVVYFRSLFFAPGIAVNDLNNDGYQDFVTTSSEENATPQIYLNQQGNGFKNVTKKWIKPLKRKPYESNITPLLFDYDNDQDLDLLVTAIGCSQFYLNEDNFFEYQKNHKLSKSCENNYSALIIDLDQDRKLDILLLRYFNQRWHRTFESDDFYRVISGSPNNLFDATNGGQNQLILSSGTDIPAGKARWSFDAWQTDINNDQIKELIVANDFGSEEFFEFKHNSFLDRTRDFIFPDRRNGMNINSNYLPNNPKPHIFISNIWIKNYVEKGNFYWHDQGNDNLTDLAIASNLNNCKWAWGSVFADFNLDGYNDSYIANGYLSSKKNKNNRKGHFQFASLSTLPFKDFFKKFPSQNFEIPLEISENYDSVSGNQADCLKIYNSETNKFEDTSPINGAKPIWDGRAVATIDYDNDGDLDLLVTAQNNYLHLFKNTTLEETPKTNWIGFDIKDQQFISKITLIQGENIYYKDWNAAKTGFLSQSDPRIHFGLLNDSNVSVSFEYSDGEVKTQQDLAPGQYYNFEL